MAGPGLGITAVTGPSASWTPADATEGWLFLNGDTLGGTGNVTTWANTAATGGATNNVTTASPGVLIVGATATINGLTGKNVCRFNVPAAGLTPAGAFSGQGASGELWAVLGVTLVGAAGCYARFGNGAADFYPFADGSIYDSFGSNVRKSCGAPVTSITAFHVLRIKTAASAWTMWLNGVQQFTTATNTVSWSSTPAIGFNSSATFMKGDIAMLFAGNALAAGTVANMQAYINSKYGFSL